MSVRLPFMFLMSFFCDYIYNLFNSYRPQPERKNEPSLQTYKFIFEFGPPQLNLFRYITKKAGILWKEAKEICILKASGIPTEGPLLICKDDESNVNDCLKVAGFDVYQQEKLLKSWLPIFI